jgi:hypothetical protein
LLIALSSSFLFSVSVERVHPLAAATNLPLFMSKKQAKNMAS